MIHYEQEMQKAVIRHVKIKYPDVLFTISPIVKLSIRQGTIMKALGYRAGTPDIMFFEPRRGYHGLFIEMKTNKTPYCEKGSLQPSQVEFLNQLNSKGYLAVVCYGVDHAIKVIDYYLL